MWRLRLRPLRRGARGARPGRRSDGEWGRDAGIHTGGIRGGKGGIRGVTSFPFLFLRGDKGWKAREKQRWTLYSSTTTPHYTRLDTARPMAHLPERRGATRRHPQRIQPASHPTARVAQTLPLPLRLRLRLPLPLTASSGMVRLARASSSSYRSYGGTRYSGSRSTSTTTSVARLNP